MAIMAILTAVAAQTRSEMKLVAFQNGPQFYEFTPCAFSDVSSSVALN
jgi:hypothetical protein